MKNDYKGKAKYILAAAAMAFFVAVTATGRPEVSGYEKFFKTLTADTLPFPGNKRLRDIKSIEQKRTDSSIEKKNNLLNTVGRDSSLPEGVEADSFSIKMSKDSLDAPVVYHADDSMVMSVPQKRITLYGKKSTTKYKDNELKAPTISFDQGTNIVSAHHTKDSTGKVIASPAFKQGEMLTVSDTIQFNMKTGKGLTKGTYTQQGEMYVYGERIKKVDSTAFFAYRARLTTCNLDTPHFAFVSKKIKFINNKFAVTGPVHPEFEGVPLPIYLPFGIYPMYQGRHSGLIAPTFTANAQFGLALEGIGYYKVLSDNWDVTARGTLYSYGGWTLNISPRYYKRYHYQGSFSLDMQKTKVNFKGDPDFSSTSTFNFRWNHNADTKSRPGVTFSASVNAGSSKFNQNVPNNVQRNFNNIFGSTINYSKVWKDKPFNISLVANHNQNTNQKQISVTLPDMSFNLNTIYPFRRKEAAGTLKWYENVGVALNSNVRSQTNFYDDTANAINDKRPVFTQIVNNWQWGGTHNVPISLSLPPLGPLQVSPGVSYSERWFQKKTTLQWNDTTKRIDTSISKGFYSAREMSFSLSASTRIFGMFGFKKTSKVQAIRHEIRPSFGISYKPDMNGKYYKTIQADTAKGTREYNVYQDNLSGPYGQGKFGGISFGLDNVIQMKVRNNKDTAEGATKKVTLIDGFSINGSYNFLIDSFQFSPLSISARTNLFDKFNITASASSNLYQVDTNGRAINRLIWKDKPFSLGRLSSGSISLSTSFQGGDKSKKTQQDKQRNVSTLDPVTGQPLNDYESEAAYIRNNPAEFTDFSIPWSFQFGYSFRFQKTFSKPTQGFKTTTNSDVTFSGTLGLTPKWQLSMNGAYNLTSKELGIVTLSIAREMHCWQMAISVSPVGRSRYFNITISPKSGLLRDIKINRTRYFFDL
jgi:LPS-assembly protein